MENLNLPQTPESELRDIMLLQEREREWWENVPEMKTQEDIDAAVAGGLAEKVADGRYYKISAKVPEGFRTLDVETKRLLDDVADAWAAELAVRGVDCAKENLFLVVSSLARTLAYQEELRLKGYPAAEESTHTKLGAFDIAVAWFKKNRPDAAEALEIIARRFTESDQANVIPEPTVGALHFARNPQK